ncbi:MAG: hypothetical protein KKE20_06085 [Nanoarchaeota archaeon]|nr:hypothetical protein [Nanoarchaeota archaeon]
MKKRGQLTVFIVIGIFLLAFLGVVLYFRHDRAIEELPEVIPEYLFPVKKYIDGCLDKTAHEGLLVLGAQGGYIYLPERIAYDPSAYVLFGKIKIPLWYYKGMSRVPTIEVMEKELDRYISENIDRCLQDFDVLSEQYDIMPGLERSVSTKITETGVDILMKYPMDVRVKGETSTTRITKFTADLNVKLKNMLSLAREIMVAENSQMFFEDLTIDLMALGPDIPFTDVTFECGQKRWYVYEVEQEIKDLLYYNIPKIRIKSTDYYPFEQHYTKYELLRGYTPQDIAEGRTPKDVPSDSYEYFHFFWDPTVKQYKDLKAFFYYQKEWPFTINVNPSKGQVMQSSWGKGTPQYWLSFLCINTYHFTYDVVYPVEVVVRDDSAFTGRGYSFRFAFPVMIHNNQGQRANFDLESMDTPSGNDGEYCNDVTDKSMMIFAKDKKTREDILDAKISFNCMNLYYCDLGITDTEFGRNRLAVQIPGFCSPPTFEAEHPNYYKGSVTVDADAAFANIIMTPVKKMSFTVAKQRVTGSDVQGEEALEPGESAVIYISTDKLQDYDAFLRYPFDEDTPEDLKYLKLPDDDLTYRLEVVLLSKTNQIIGGWRGNWTVDDASLKGKNNIKFKAIEIIPHPESNNDIALLVSKLESGTYNSIVKTVFT